LRLAVLLHRERAEEPVVLAGARARGKTLTLTFQAGWLAAHPLTLADLEGEREELRAIGLKLVFA
jgi:exopolyphosphatase/guanosine-5'-triphosphate,3'-diphosphate pyrophosphatase